MNRPAPRTSPIFPHGAEDYDEWRRQARRSDQQQTELTVLVAGGTIIFKAKNRELVTMFPGQSVSGHSSGDGVIFANASTNSKHCSGLVTEIIPPGAVGAIQSKGLLSLTDWSLSLGDVSLTAKATYFLSTTSGKLTDVSPDVTGNVSQFVGRQVDEQTMDIQVAEAILC